jgi:hypothetical protein
MIMDTNKSTSRRQVRKGDRPCGGSRSANVRADGQKPHIRLSPWASWHHTTKPTGSRGRVNAAVAHGRFTFLSGEICASRDRRFMSINRKRSNRLTKDQAYTAAVGGYESFLGDTKQTATHEQFYSALRGDTAGKHAEVSRGHISCRDRVALSV